MAHDGSDNRIRRWRRYGNSWRLRFNHGGARYRMLDAGEYRIQLVYQPMWDDDAMIEAGVGRVESNVVTARVTEEAPAAVRIHKKPILVIERAGEVLSQGDQLQ